mgnify:CR=1 FL=1
MEPEFIVYRSTEPQFVLKNQRSIGGTIATLVHLGLGWVDVTILEMKLLDRGPRPNMLYINCGNYFGVMKVEQSIYITSNVINDICTQNRDGTIYKSRWSATFSFKQIDGN